MSSGDGKWLSALDARYDAFTRHYGPNLFDDVRSVIGGACAFCCASRRVAWAGGDAGEVVGWDAAGLGGPGGSQWARSGRWASGPLELII